MGERHARHRRRIEAPSVADVEALARADGIELRDGEAADLARTIVALVVAAARAEEHEMLEAPLRAGARDPGRRPAPDEDPHNAFIRFCRVQGAPEGPLAGRTVAVKDTIAIGGVPMTEGSLLPPFVPSTDSTVVERVLDAGGTITGTLNMDEMGGGATGVMSAFGPARNPVDPTRTAGGSSGGAGAAVRSGAVDLALGVDQGGSGRIPAAFCGVVCIKPTHGLVSTYGVGHIDHTLDFVTPLARSVADAAVLLEAIAGEDWRNPQCARGELGTGDYLGAREAGADGLRIGVVEESVTSVDTEPEVVDGLERAVSALGAAGAIVERFSLPIWADGFATYQPLVTHLFANTIRSEGVGYGHFGYIDVDRLHAFAVARRAQSVNLNPYIKCWLLADRFLHDEHLNLSYGRLQNQRLLIRRRIDETFDRFDLLLTPTVPLVAPKLFDHEPSIDELLTHTPANVAFNTAPLNLTGHPGISVPTERGREGMLPTAVQIVAPRFAEREALRAAFALETELGSRA
jgi:amidase